MADRLQKVLAAAGVASRRQAEEWIRAGRVTVNGKPAEIGQSVDEDDTIAVDGRRLRLERAAPAQLVLMYHRPAGEALRESTPSADGEAPAPTTYDRLPPARGRRWLPLSPLAPSDGGLELFTTDGDLRAAASRMAHELPSVYAIRVRGEPTADLLQSLPAHALAMDPPFQIDSVNASGGEARNQWLELVVRGARGRDLRALLVDRGLEVGRVMRVRFGPIALDPTLARVRHRELAENERDALYVALGLPGPGAERRAAARRERAAGGGRSENVGGAVRRGRGATTRERGARDEGSRGRGSRGAGPRDRGGGKRPRR